MISFRQLIAGTIFFCISTWGIPTHAVDATVLSIGDGDTITVTQGNQKTKVRLACIDAPETSQTPYGLDARRALQALLPLGSEVTLKIKATDRYGRSVSEITKVGINVNQSLIASGNAFVYWQYIKGCDRQTYSRLESEARLKGLGVWSIPGGLERPWDYRHQRRSTNTGVATPSSKTVSTPSSIRYRCREIGSWSKAQELLKQGHSYLDGDGDGEACESLR